MLLLAKKVEPAITGGLENNPGDFLLSHRVSPAVPSALRGLTSLFGMGRGVSLSLWSPETLKTVPRSATCGAPSNLHSDRVMCKVKTSTD
jgi:hypothetical protein